jgi:dATP pyrophosphohydrolase
MPNFVCKTIQTHIVRLNSNNKYEHLVLQRQDNDFRYPSLWQVVTGTIEENEKAVQTALREFFEETGLDLISMWTIPFVTSFFDAIQDSIHHAPVFGILVDSNCQVKLSHEHQQFVWLEANKCIDLLTLPSHKEATKVFEEYILQNEDKRAFRVSEQIIKLYSHNSENNVK